METPTNNDLAPELPTSSARTIDLSPDDIIAGLDAANDYLPIVSILAARAKRELIVPRLIDVICQATAAARAGDPPKGNAHFFAPFLLAEFKAKEAAPAIVEAISLPGQLSYDLFGEAMTMCVASILAFMIGDRLEVVDELIRNRELDQFVRWELAEIYVELAADDRMTRDEAVRRLQSQLREAIENKDTEITGPLISVLLSLEGREALEEIETAFRLDLVDESLIGREDIEFELESDDLKFRDRLKRYAHGPIDDTIAELEDWAAFVEVEDDNDDADLLSDDERREYEALWRSQTSLATPLVPRPRIEDSLVMPTESLAAGTVRHTAPRVGRNDPCPCGSGKKFKKCCGAPG